MGTEEMKNLLFFLWMMFFPLVDNITTWVIWQTKGEKMKENSYEWIEVVANGILYLIVGYLLYERS